MYVFTHYRAERQKIQITEGLFGCLMSLSGAAGKAERRDGTFEVVKGSSMDVELLLLLLFCLFFGGIFLFLTKVLPGLNFWKLHVGL